MGNYPDDQRIDALIDQAREDFVNNCGVLSVDIEFSLTEAGLDVHSITDQLSKELI